MEEEKIGFWKQFKIAILKIEEYDNLVVRKVSVSIKYFILLMLIISIIMSGIESFLAYKQLSTGYNYIKNELPEFSYEDGIYKSEANVEAYDSKYKTKLYINTDDVVEDEKIEEYKNNTASDENLFILLKDKAEIIVTGQSVDETLNYTDIQGILGDVQITNKEDLINAIDNVGLNSVVLILFLEYTLAAFVGNVIELFLSALVVALFGYIATFFAKMKLKLNQLIILAIYATTLPNILYLVYNEVNAFTGFYIKYFSIFYMLIAYVYMLAAIFMIKSDLIKQEQEIKSIVEVQKQVHEETEEETEEDTKEPENKEKENEDKKEEKEEKNPDIDENREPDGSEI